MKIEDTTVVSGPVVAVFLSITPRQVINLTNSGVLSQGSKSKYDLIAAIQAYREYELRGKRNQDNVESRQRLETAKASKAEIETELLEGKLVDVELVQQVFNEAMVLIATQLDGIGGRLAGEISGITDAAIIRHKLLDETRRIRAAAADKLALLGAVGSGGGNIASAASKNNRSVGKSKPRTSTGERGAGAMAE